MSNIRTLLEKSKTTIHEDGMSVFLCKTINYLKKVRAKEDHSESPEKMFMDVLFINGCYLPHPSRYRVSHQREQLLAANMASNEVFYENISLDLVKRYRVFVFFRCPFTDEIGEFISCAKKMNKKVLFDIDDLVIDRCYTDEIPYLKTMSAEEKRGYDSGVERMQKTLRLCDAAITTTDALADELRKYVPEVYINRNVASDRMVALSEEAIYQRDVLAFMRDDEVPHHLRRTAMNARKLAEKREKVIRLGYFSGSITHNDDVELILPALVRIMEDHPNTELHLVGELDLPDELKCFSERIISRPFVSWEKLPQLIASVDINLAPLQDTLFNAAKSENKWVEAALVKVPTVASTVGAMQQMIQDGYTGCLCRTELDWYTTLTELINDEVKRKEIAEAAYHFVKKNCVTIYTSYGIAQYMKMHMTPNFVFVLPSIQTSGGVLVALKHAVIMQQAGYDVLILNEGAEERSVEYLGQKLPVISTQRTQVHAHIDKAVATLWTTVNFIRLYPAILQRYYLVQGFETDFYPYGNFFKFSANQTYYLDDIIYLTISKWCEAWLKKDYHCDVRYVPNGIDLMRFASKYRGMNQDKVRILIEGNSDDYYKNVDEAFKIVQKLPKDQYEIWFMSYQGEPKDWYYVDRFLHRVPYAEVPDVYRQCDILLKTSILESFSYPPLEMMATGGYAVVAPNDGNIEYLRDEENCLMYQQGDIDGAVNAIHRIVADETLREKLYRNGLLTAKERDWETLRESVVKFYE